MWKALRQIDRYKIKSENLYTKCNESILAMLIRIRHAELQARALSIVIHLAIIYDLPGI